MKKITLAITDQLMAQLGLTAAADELAVATAIKDLSVKAAKVDTIQAQLVTTQQKNTELETELTAIKGKANKDAIKAMLDAALEGNKISVELSKQLEKDYAENPDGLKTVLTSMGAYTSVVGQIQQEAKKDSSKYDGRSWDDIFEKGEMDAFRTGHPDAYKKLYKETFKSDPA